MKYFFILILMIKSLTGSGQTNNVHDWNTFNKESDNLSEWIKSLGAVQVNEIEQTLWDLGPSVSGTSLKEVGVALVGDTKIPCSVIHQAMDNSSYFLKRFNVLKQETIDLLPRYIESSGDEYDRLKSMIDRKIKEMNELIELLKKNLDRSFYHEDRILTYYYHLLDIDQRPIDYSNSKAIPVEITEVQRYKKGKGDWVNHGGASLEQIYGFGQFVFKFENQYVFGIKRKMRAIDYCTQDLTLKIHAKVKFKSNPGKVLEHEICIFKDLHCFDRSTSMDSLLKCLGTVDRWQEPINPRFPGGFPPLKERTIDLNTYLLDRDFMVREQQIDCPMNNDAKPDLVWYRKILF
jgi:hypothetical protein